MDLDKLNKCIRKSAYITLPVLIFNLSACSGNKDSTVEAVARPAYVVEVKQAVGDGLSFTGEVRAIQRADMTFPVSGLVSHVAVDVGDTVHRGQILATLDKRPLTAQFDAANHELLRAAAQFNEVKQRHERVMQASKNGAANVGEVNAIQAELLAAEANHRIASAQRNAAEWSLEQAVMRAPISGTIASRSIESGHAVGSGSPGLTIDGAGRELSILIPDSTSIAIGQSISLENSGTTFSSKVLRISSRLEAGGVRRIFLTVPENASVGSVWSAYLDSSSRKNGVQIPLRALLPNQNKNHAHVLRIAKDGRTVELIMVKIGILHGDSIEITDGLNVGDQVVVAGAAGIRPGTLVKPVTYRGEIKS